MKKFYTGPLGLIVLLLCLVISSCSTEDDPIPGTSMELTIVNDLGNPVEGATVNLYNSEEAFVLDNQNDAVTTGASGKDGKVLLKDLESKTYYFSVTHGTTTVLTNWEGAVTTENAIEENKVNTLNVVIKESIYAYLAGGQKGWILDKVYIGTEDYTSEMPACTMDDVMTFMRSFRYNFSEGATKCEDTDPQEENGLFSLNGTDLITTSEAGEESTAYVIEINNEELVMNGPDLRSDVRMVYKAVYK